MNVVLVIGLALLLNFQNDFSVSCVDLTPKEKEDFCKALTDGHEIEDIITNCAGLEVVSGTRKLLDLSEVGGPGILSLVKDATTIDIPIKVCNSNVTYIDAINWATSGKGVTMEVCNNDELNRFELREATKIISLKINNNAKIHSLRIAKVKSILTMEVTGNLLSVEFVIAKVKEIKKTTVENNEKLIKMETPLVEIIEDLSIKNNPSLDTINLGSRKETDLKGSNAISNNPALKEITFGKVKASTGNPKEFVVFNNPNLESIVASSDGKLNNIRVRGNYKLSNQSIEDLKAICDSTCDIQGFHECIIDAPVSDLSQLDACGSVYGNLILTSDVKGQRTAEMERIEGDLTIENTNLTMEELGFLNGTEITGNVVFTGNDQICDGEATLNQLFINAVGSKTIETKACPTIPVTTTDAPTTEAPTTAKSTETTAKTGGENGTSSGSRESKENNNERGEGVEMAGDRTVGLYFVYIFGVLVATAFIVGIPYFAVQIVRNKI